MQEATSSFNDCNNDNPSSHSIWLEELATQNKKYRF